MEYVFTNSSINSTILDLIRVFNRTTKYLRTPNGFMTGKEDVGGFIRNLSRLCRHLNGILAAEPKFLRLNGPAIVVGDIQGNLNDLLAIEEALFTSFPAISENLVFLGNYTGQYPYGVECLLYLFALKMCAPNKCFLLRGNAETRAKSSDSLRSECFNKYGRTTGSQVFEMFNDVFSKLPIAATLDQTILCVHSGIPKWNSKSVADFVSNLPDVIFDPQRDAPIAYEVSLS